MCQRIYYNQKQNTMTRIYLDNIVNQESKCTCGHIAREHYSFTVSRYDAGKRELKYGACLIQEGGKYCPCNEFVEVRKCMR